MFKKALIGAAMLATLPLTAGAATWTFSGALNTLQETSPVAVPSPYFGGGLLAATLNDVTGAFVLDVFFSGLTGPTGGQHIHEAPPGMAGPVIFHLPAPVPAPLPAVPGIFSIHFATTLLPADLDGLTFDGGGAFGVGDPTNWYVNLHTGANVAGEIRGQLLVSSVVVPLPASLALLVPALGGLVLIRRRT